MFWKIVKAESRGSEANHIWVEYRLNQSDEKPYATEDYDVSSEWDHDAVSTDIGKHAEMLEPSPLPDAQDPSSLVGLSGSSS
jgi:hypothetical protein